MESETTSETDDPLIKIKSMVTKFENNLRESIENQEAVQALSILLSICGKLLSIITKISENAIPPPPRPPAGQDGDGALQDEYKKFVKAILKPNAAWTKSAFPAFFDAANDAHADPNKFLFPNASTADLAATQFITALNAKFTDDATRLITALGGGEGGSGGEDGGGDEGGEDGGGDEGGNPRLREAGRGRSDEETPAEKAKKAVTIAIQGKNKLDIINQLTKLGENLAQAGGKKRTRKARKARKAKKSKKRLPSKKRKARKSMRKH